MNQKEVKKLNKRSKKHILDLFRRLNQHMLTLIDKNGTNPDQASLIINRLNSEIDKHFGVKNEYKVKLTFDVGSGQMIMHPNNEKTEELFDLWWKYNSDTK